MAQKKKSPHQPRASRPHMPGYGLPKGTKGLLPWKWADDRLKISHNYWISTVRTDGSPHTMIVWAMWLDGTLYFSTGAQSLKAKNLARNSNCVMCTELADRAVIVEGTAKAVRDVSLIRRILPLYERKYQFDMSGMEKDLLSLKEPIFAVRPRVVFGLDEKKTLNSATRWNFE
jgi:Pyridoxamine 5'-phosphate oxidase